MNEPQIPTAHRQRWDIGWNIKLFVGLSSGMTLEPDNGETAHSTKNISALVCRVPLTFVDCSACKVLTVNNINLFCMYV